MDRESIVESARSFIDVPWLYRGRSINGLDCGGLLIVVFRSVGLIDENFDEVFDIDQSYQGLHQTLSRFADEIPIESENMDGDIWTYSFSGDMHAHCAICSVSTQTIIHAYPSVQKVSEHSWSGKWTRRIHKKYRMRGIDG